MSNREDRRQRDAWLSALHRGGTMAYWWIAEGRVSRWWEVGKPSALPNGRLSVYVGVHPTHEVPAHNRRGEPAEPSAVRAHINGIAALNCLFAEFDAKDFDGDKAATLAHVEGSPFAPSIIIDSGGGYHAYWLLSEPWILSEGNRAEAASLQARWVAWVGGDEGAKDLARVLRVPGTYNHKYTPPRKVSFVRCDLDRRYDLATLTAALPEANPAPAATSGPAPADRSAEWAQRKLGDAVRMVATAPSGSRHTVLLKAARLAGGVTPHVTEQEIVRALTAASPGGWEDDREVERVILDGIAYGQQSPLSPPPTPPALQWRGGVAYCPRCGESVRPSKFYDDGLYCSCERPALTWRGDEAAAPAGVQADRGWREDADAAPEDRPTYVSGPTMPHGISSLTTVPPPPVIWYAPGFIREGLGLIVGQPNVGKTPLAAQMGLAAAAGIRWLDAVQVQPCKVLYLGCEYSRQELYPLLTESMAAMKLAVGSEITDDNFAYKTQDDPLPDNPDAAVADLEFYISLGYRLIIIDTLTAFLPPEKFKQNVYRGDYKELQPYHRLALKHSVAIVGVWHASKREADPKLMYNGSTGMWAVPSSRIAMYEDTEGRKRISSFPRLGDRTDWALTQEKSIVGRRWVVADATPEPMEMGPQERDVYRWLRENSSKATPKTPATIAEMTGVPNASVRKVLERMVAKNRAHRVGSGSYYVEKNDVTLVTDVTDVTVVTDVTGKHGNSFASRSVTKTETCHGDVTGTDGVGTPQNGSVTSVTTFSSDNAGNVVTQDDASLIVPLESVPAEVLPRSEWTHEPTAEDIVVAHDPSHATAPWCIVVRNTGRRLGRFLTRSAALQEARTLRSQEV